MADYLNYVRTFIPNSANAYDDPTITLKGIERFPYALEELGRYSSEAVEESSVYAFNIEQQMAGKLGKLFTFHGSDKEQLQYHLVYGELLHAFSSKQVINILEIGIGTNNEEIISNMSRYGTPGASLRAFCDGLPNAKVFGADIDKNILFEEERIQTAWVDQMNPLSFLEMNKSFGNQKYDLIIDDGLHAVSANLNTLLFGLTVLKKGGWIVIEDIGTHRVCWNTIFRLLSFNDFNKYIIKCPHSYLFLVQLK